MAKDIHHTPLGSGRPLGDADDVAAPDLEVHRPGLGVAERLGQPLPIYCQSQAVQTDGIDDVVTLSAHTAYVT